MSKEPKSPKGEKASERFWKIRGIDPVWPGQIFLSEEHKEVYDELLSLESYIAILEFIREENLAKFYNERLAQLLKEHNL